MRASILIVILTGVALGCARSGQAPVAPDTGPEGALARPSQMNAGPYRLYGEWTFFINDTHDRVDVVPRREARFHLNALKFLEEYCTNCLSITGISKNPDSTVDVQIRITHPFTGHPEYTGFDVKGIIMFQGSHEIYNKSMYDPLYPQPYRASWRLLGDPELLNADGYSYRWSPWYDSGSDLPMYNYWPGKYSKGTPTANINGYLSYYSNENRHMFETGKTVTRTYHIWLPPGQPTEAGYAVEACWEPPLVTPVTNPAEDFPITANQGEAYRFHCVINDGLPVTHDDSCCLPPQSVTKARAEMDFWYIVPDLDLFWVKTYSPEIEFYFSGVQQCDGPLNWYCMDAQYSFLQVPKGTYQFIAIEFPCWTIWPQPDRSPYIGVELFEVVVDME
jgi:hypothetical protein